MAHWPSPAFSAQCCLVRHRFGDPLRQGGVRRDQEHAARRLAGDRRGHAPQHQTVQPAAPMGARASRGRRDARSARGGSRTAPPRAGRRSPPGRAPPAGSPARNGAALSASVRSTCSKDVSAGPLPLALEGERVEEAQGVDRPHLGLSAARELGDEVQPAAEGVGRERRQVDGSQHAPRRHRQLAADHQDGAGGLPQDPVRGGAQQLGGERPRPGGADHDQVGPGPSARCR